MRRKPPATLVLISALALAALTGCTTTAGPSVVETSAATPTTVATANPGDSGESAPPQNSTPTATVEPDADSALAVLDTLDVREWAPDEGYDRTGVFGTAWKDVDHNGCDTRNDILNRDMTNIDKDGTCTVLTGDLLEPYTGKTIHFVRGRGTSRAVQIEHVVALKNAWLTGAQDLTFDQRLHLANDPVNLLAADGPENQSKGSKDAANYLPPNESFHCQYVAQQVTVKDKYELWVTEPEKTAMEDVLETCPDEPLYDGGGISVEPVPDGEQHKETTPEPSDHSDSDDGDDDETVHPGSFCSPKGATGKTTKGTDMVCSPKNDGDTPRWRSAP